MAVIIFAQKSIPSHDTYTHSVKHGISSYSPQSRKPNKTKKSHTKTDKERKNEERIGFILQCHNYRLGT